jgi:pimeloyl-ACP methyl ester carboxylesterase
MTSELHASSVVAHTAQGGQAKLLRVLDFRLLGLCVCLQESDMTSELHASSVVALLDHLDVTNATLVMHDW